MVTKAIILSGGEGTRLSPLTQKFPKQLIPLANIPIIDLVIEDILECGITEICIILGNNSPKLVKDHINEKFSSGANLTFIKQGDALGIAHAVLCAKEFIGTDSFLVYLGDNVLENGIYEYYLEFQTHNVPTILLSPVENPEAYGIAIIDPDDGSVFHLEEKPPKSNSNLAIVGVYLLTPAIIQYMENLEPSHRNELEITDALENMIMDGGTMKGRIIKGWWKDTGTLKEVLDANKKIIDKELGKNNIDRDGLEGHLKNRTEYSPTMNDLFRGPLIIGDTTIPLGNSIIGPYVSLGNEIMIDNCNISNSVLSGKEILIKGMTIKNSFIKDKIWVELKENELFVHSSM